MKLSFAGATGNRDRNRNKISNRRMAAVLVFLAIVASGCARQAPDPTRLRADETALIQATVAEPARAQRLLALLEQRDRLNEETSAMVQQYRRELKALNGDYDATHEISVEMIDYYNRERAQKLLRFIDLVAQMKAVTTAAEWKVIAGFQLAHFNPRRLIFGRATGGS